MLDLCLIAHYSNNINNEHGAEKMSAKLQAFTFLKSLGLIDRATDARYLGCHGGDHFFGLVGGDICAVDLVTRAVKSCGVVVIRGAA